MILLRMKKKMHEILNPSVLAACMKTLQSHNTFTEGIGFLQNDPKNDTQM